MAEEDHNPFAAPNSLDVVTVPPGSVDYEALRTTGNGLRLIYISLLLLVIIAIGTFAGAMLQQRAPGPSQAGLGLIILVGIGMLIAAVLSIIGGLMCTTVPHESRGKGLVIASVVFQAMNTLMMISVAFGIALGAMSLMQTLLNGTSLVFFLIFLGRLAQFIQRKDLARRATRLLIFQILFVVGAIIAGIAAFNLSSGLSTGIVGLVVGVAFLALFLMYANLINDMSKAIRHPGTSVEGSKGHI